MTTASEPLALGAIVIAILTAGLMARHNVRRMSRRAGPDDNTAATDDSVQRLAAFVSADLWVSLAEVRALAVGIATAADDNDDLRASMQSIEQNAGRIRTTLADLFEIIGLDVESEMSDRDRSTPAKVLTTHPGANQGGDHQPAR